MFPFHAVLDSTRKPKLILSTFLNGEYSVPVTLYLAISGKPIINE